MNKKSFGVSKPNQKKDLVGCLKTEQKENDCLKTEQKETSCLKTKHKETGCLKTQGQSLYSYLRTGIRDS